MPTFVAVKKAIQAEARAPGEHMPVSRAKYLAAQYLNALHADPLTGSKSPLTYADPVGEAAVKKWFRATTASGGARE